MQRGAGHTLSVWFCFWFSSFVSEQLLYFRFLCNNCSQVKWKRGFGEIWSAVNRSCSAVQSSGFKSVQHNVGGAILWKMQCAISVQYLHKNAVCNASAVRSAANLWFGTHAHCTSIGHPILWCTLTQNTFKVTQNTFKVPPWFNIMWVVQYCGNCWVQ